MTWSLRAEGHAFSEAAEKKLFRLLNQVFTKDEVGAVTLAQFDGNHIQGNPLSDTDFESAKQLSPDADKPDVPLGLEGIYAAEYDPNRDQRTDEEKAEDEKDEDPPEAGLVPKGGSYPAQKVEPETKSEPEVKAGA